jgi:hypothetical protein
VAELDKAAIDKTAIDKTATSEAVTDKTGINEMGINDTGTNETGISETGPTEDTTTPARRRGPDPVALLIGLLTLGMAVAAFVGQLPDLSGLDLRWLLAGGAAAVGLMLLVGSLRGRRGANRGDG